MHDDELDNFEGERVARREQSRLFAADDPAQSSKPVAPRYSSASVITVLVLVLGAGALYGMRTMALGNESTVADLDIDYNPAERPKVDASEYNLVLGHLGRTDTTVQISEASLAGKAFWMEPRKEPEREVRRAPREEPKVDPIPGLIAGAFEKLELQSVMGGRTPVARIDDQTVMLGSRVGEYFTIEAIEGREVKLKDIRGGEWVLRMGASLRR